MIEKKAPEAPTQTTDKQMLVPVAGSTNTCRRHRAKHLKNCRKVFWKQSNNKHDTWTGMFIVTPWVSGRGGLYR